MFQEIIHKKKTSAETNEMNETDLLKKKVFRRHTQTQDFLNLEFSVEWFHGSWLETELYSSKMGPKGAQLQFNGPWSGMCFFLAACG